MKSFKNTDVCVVSAMFDIKRGNWNTYVRSFDKYVSYFEFWGRMQNQLVIYVDSNDLKERILFIRRKFGLEDKTIVNVINDISTLDRELYNSIKSATHNQIQIESRLFPNNPEAWNCDYNYIMMLKFWCIKNTIDYYEVPENIVWLDFGFGHGEDNFLDPEDFDFEWKYQFNDKIYLFNIQKLDNRPIFDIIKSMDTYFMGPIILGTKNAWNKMYKLTRKCMLNLNSAGLVDDDQTILLMAYRSQPDLFIVEESTWFRPIQKYASNNIRFKDRANRRNCLKEIYHMYKHFLQINKMQKREKKRYKVMHIH